MGKNKKKEKKQKKQSSSREDVKSVMQALRAENETLRARLEKIAELAGDLPVRGDEDDETDDRDEEMKEGAPADGQDGTPV